MKFALLMLSLIFNVVVVQNADANSVQDIINTATQTSPQNIDHRHYWLELNLKSDISFQEKGFAIGVGHRWDWFGVDVRGLYGKTSYGAIEGFVDPSQDVSTGNQSPNTGAQSILARSSSDSWSYTALEPGISIESKWFPTILPLFSEKARVGMEWGNFNDSVNNLSFTGYLFTCDATLIYQLSAHSPYSISASIFWDTGNLMLNGASTLSDADRHLAVNWLGTSVGLLYSF